MTYLYRCVLTHKVDRPTNEAGIDAETVVIFPDGYRVRFWVTGLSDDEYIRRAELLRSIELESKYEK